MPAETILEGAPPTATPPTGDPPAPTPAQPAGDPPTPAPTSPPAEPVYDLKLPDGAVIDKVVLDQTVEFAKTHKLTPEQAQQLLDIRNADRSEYQAAAAAKLEEQVSQWAEQSRSDPAIVGQDKNQFDATVALALRARDQFATPELRKLLKETGFGNHPEVIKLFAAVGRAMKEDAFHAPGNPPAPPKDLAALLYPTTTTQPQ